MKEFISYRKIRDNAIKLAHRIHQDGFIPDVIYVSLRGGAYLGNVISEYFKLVRRDNERPVFYAAVVAHSYTGVQQQQHIRIDGWTYDPQHLRHGDKVLIVDDIFDSGRTINYLVEVIVANGVPRNDVRIAVHDYKIRNFQKEQLAIHPEYYCRKIEMNSPQEDNWVHYLSHELVGLTPDEIEEHYSEDPEVAEILKQLNS
ncbi:Hypoxanthine-guanine phosphoribosyltransferase [Salinispira pacifica]|uniref:Hypoxanthine-guanine phosphoribosyltransferase n=1 Tax=Salinispira pacifica TaxID=1307761 RepID=V5WHE5_9SPIO|nr:Hypoxanthine-guanine phosphoribosyltransferase [Salinispira pacifica]